MEHNDQRIVRLCKKDSREGYRMLYENYHRYVYTLCYRSTYHHEDAMDLVQEVFLKAFKGMERFDESKPLQPWIKKIAVNVCVNHSNRKPQNEISCDFQEDASLGLTDEAHDDEKPENSIENKETRSIIEKAITQLPGNERTVIILRHFENKSYEEIAKLMACPLGTVKTYIYRARKLLKEALVNQGVWEVPS